MSKYCQIGSVAMRGLDGKFMPSIPLYAEEDTLDKGTAENIGRALTALLKEQLTARMAKGASA